MNRPSDDEFRALETRLMKHETSEAERDALLADDFFEIGRSGKEYDKRSVMEHLRQRAASDFEIDSLRTVEIAPGVVQVLYRTVRHDLDGQKTLRSSLWFRREGAWRLVFHQGTPEA